MSELREHLTWVLKYNIAFSVVCEGDQDPLTDGLLAHMETLKS